MSMYNLMFGKNPQSDILLAVVGLKSNDVERFRDAHSTEDGKMIEVYTRTGGGNRADYPQELMRHKTGWVASVDDDFDNTYCTDTFKVPEEFIEDVKNLIDIFANGLRKEFCQHISKTLKREPTESDKETAANESEGREIARTEHFLANGHTFVPKNDTAMEAALKLAEANGGELRSCWGILPLEITVKTNFYPYPKAKAETDRLHMNRIEVNYEWKIDTTYWAHCQERWNAMYPITMRKISDDVEQHLRNEKK